MAAAATCYLRFPNSPAVVPPSPSPRNRVLLQTCCFRFPTPAVVASLQQRRVTATRSAASGSASVSSSSGGGGLYLAAQYELTVENVDMVLEDVRPYLIADGGNVDVVSVEDGIISLQLQGACESCPSSTTTMTMGIERVLKEKFGDAVKEIRQMGIDEQIKEVTAEAVNGHLDVLRPAIKNYGGSVQVLSVEGIDCVVKYEGPESIGSGIKAAIKERFPAIVNVVFTD